MATITLEKMENVNTKGILPPGKYVASIVDTNIEDPIGNNAVQKLVVKFAISAGQETGRRISDWFAIWGNTDQSAYAKRRLAQLFSSIGVTRTDGNFETEDMHGLQVVIDVIVKEARYGKECNYIKAYLPVTQFKK